MRWWKLMECAFRFLPVHHSAFPGNYQEPLEARERGYARSWPTVWQRVVLNKRTLNVRVYEWTIWYLHNPWQKCCRVLFVSHSSATRFLIFQYPRPFSLFPGPFPAGSEGVSIYQIFHPLALFILKVAFITSSSVSKTWVLCCFIFLFIKRD